MKIRFLIVSILLLTIGIAAVNAASMSGNTVVVTNPADAAALVYVSGYTLDPQVFYPYETGTVTVYVTNSANMSVGISQPDLIDPKVHVINQNSFATMTNLGPGETVEFTFVVTVDPPDGTLFPLFTVSPKWYGDPIHANVKIKVDSSDVRASIAKKPDTFSISKKDTVNVSVVNPRSGDITNVLIIPDADGATVTPSEFYVGTIKAGGSVQVPFDIIPDKETDVTFHVDYNNGDNKRTSDLVLPLTLGKNKMGAEIVVNNIESTNAGSTITLKGDVTNNGLSDAKSVLVTVGSPATPVNPNPVYAIGNLQPDDFSSFEVTYAISGPGAVPIIVEYKDSDGNVFTSKFSYSSNGTAFGTGGSGSIPNAQSGASSVSSVNRRGGGGMFGSFGSGFNQLPVTEIVVILVAIIALVIAWRKGLLKRLADRFRKKPKTEAELEEQ
jgi:hypothetical protein